ncbi:MAG: hypothetical protein JSR63_07800 [Proteobacteria bacterium]|nr:hypothetical protein [Pseudomonadota bacterium]
MAFDVSGARIWPVPPDWSAGVKESLAWGSDVMQASGTAVTQHRSWRASPRRAFSFNVLADAQSRRVAEMLIAGWNGAWQLPIWPDVQVLSATLASGATSIPCNTTGFDFVAGGKALLYSSVNTWAVVSIASIASGALTLSAATTAAWPAGTRLYPLRKARLRDNAQERQLSDDIGNRSLTFDISEFCDWPVLTGVTQYLGHDVLEKRPDEGEDPTSSFARLQQTVDYGGAFPVVADLPGIALRVQQTNWVLYGRPEHTWYRSFLYTRCGRTAPIWVPSFTADLKAAASIAGNSTTLSVEWAGYTLFGKGKANRKDVRIELMDGTVYYRRITNSVEAGATETLTLSALLRATAITPTQIRQISFLSLCTLAGDELTITHETDAEGLATSTTGWQAVVPDV